MRFTIQPQPQQGSPHECSIDPVRTILLLADPRESARNAGLSARAEQPVPGSAERVLGRGTRQAEAASRMNDLDSVGSLDRGRVPRATPATVEPLMFEHRA